MDLNEPIGADVNVDTTPSSNLNEPVGEDINVSSGVTGAETAGGVSLDVVPESNFFDLLDAVLPDADTTLEFLNNPAVSIATGVVGDDFGNYKDGVTQILDNMTRENLRIENVLSERFGDKYAGEDAAGS